jgi:hypothetical protein
MNAEPIFSFLTEIKMNIQEIINSRANENTYTLELYLDDIDDNTIHEQITIPEPVTKFISDIDCNKYIFPETLSVIDIDSTVDNLPIIFNIPQNIEHIILRHKNIFNKKLLDLFHPNFAYRYIDCSLDGVELNILVNQLYKKYFDVEPKYTSNHEANKKLMNNMLYSKVHRQITNELYTYETRMAQAKAFMKLIKEELYMAVYHPDRVEVMLNKYGHDFIEAL